MCGDRRSWAEDGDLATEIELYGDLVVAASESERDLTLPQIDRVLGVDGARERPVDSTASGDADDATAVPR